jgi:hypothetical protein
VFVQQRTKSVKTKTKERKKERKEDKQQMVDDSNPQKFTFRDKKMKCLILLFFSFFFGVNLIQSEVHYEFVSIYEQLKQS